jgi:hypothetical protein
VKRRKEPWERIIIFEDKKGKRAIGWLGRIQGFLSALPVSVWVKGKVIGIKINFKKLFHL